MKLSMLLDDYNLPSSTMKELGSILIGISKLEKIGLVTRTQQHGKNLTSLTGAIQKQMASLAKHCMVLQPDSPAPTNKSSESTIIANKLDDNSSEVTKTGTQNSSNVVDQTEISIDTNMDNLADQGLTLPREFQPICLSHHFTITTVEDG